ncbi:haloacid dehalogenase [Cephaloticoccus capnophilus]|uniref:Haloacid dehalogenase n=1 Tax=Cephaloticoccus capnophilus TaxID=1548208 RepID=A0A139SKX7_9BACT|nr:HAD family hydrolase [Cephaloticoccus capnophilus]KXU35211.1 haloacid dehalogenase [Cephaloticoccus capnophilus]
MSFKTILLDLDGTLVDAFTTIHRAYCHTLPQFGKPAPTLDEVRRAVGGGLRDAMGHFLPQDQIDAALPIHRAFTQKILLDDLRPMPGALELVRDLHTRGVQLAVYTNKDSATSRRVCAHLGLTPLLAGIYAAGDTPWLKPEPELAAHVLRELGASPKSTLLVGDSPFDVEAAHNGGFLCWAVTTGTHSANALLAAGAARVFDGLPALHAALRAK